MDPRNTKVFIIGFLSLAILVGSATYAWSLMTKQKITPDTTEITPDTGSNPGTFNESPDAASASQPTGENLLPNEATSSEQFAIVNDNLTDLLAEEVGQELLRANPDGVIENNGQISAVAPDIDRAINNLAQKPAEPVNNWAVEAETLASLVKIEKNARADMVRNYVQTMERITNDAYVRSGLAEISSANVNPQPLGFTAPYLERAVSEARKLTVPDQFAGFHKSFINMTVQAKNLVLVSDLIYTDPVRLSLTFQANEATLNRAVDSYRTESEKAFEMGRAAGIISVNSSWNPLAIPTANAFWITFNPDRIIQEVTKYIKNTLLETLKDQVIHRLVNQTIKWVQGGGKPKFVTNFKGYLKNEVGNVVGDMVSQLESTQALCTGQLPFLRIGRISPEPEVEDYPACTLDTIVKNVDNFADHFEKGGFVAYGASLQPSNNIFGALFQVSDLALTKSETTKKAAEQETVSGQGFLGTKQCTNPVEEDIAIYQKGGTTEERAKTLVDAYAKRKNNVGKPKCNGTPGRVGYVCTFKTCGPDDYETTTPGKSIAQSIDQSLGAPLHRIISAQDFAALTSAVINSALNRLLEAGANGLSGLFQGKTAQERMGDVAPGSTGGANADPCTGISATTTNSYGEVIPNPDLDDCRQSNQNVNNATNLNIENERVTLRGNVNDIMGNWQRVTSYDSEWLGLVGEARQLLENLKTACPNQNMGGEIDDKLTALGSATSTPPTGIALRVDRENQDAQNGIASSTMMLNLLNATSVTITQLTQVTTWLNQPENNSGAIDGKATRADERLKNLKDMKSDIVANTVLDLLGISACNVPVRNPEF